MFQNTSRVIYRRNQIVNVVCQLRFPTILAVSARVAPTPSRTRSGRSSPATSSKRSGPRPSW